VRPDVVPLATTRGPERRGRTLRIAILTSRAPDPSGAEHARVAAAAQRALAARGHALVVVAPRAALADLALESSTLVAELAAREVDIVHVYGCLAAADTGCGPKLMQRLAERFPVILSLLADDGLPPHVDPAEILAAQRVVLPSVAHVVRVREHVALAAGRVRVVPAGHGLTLPKSRVRPRPYKGSGPLRVFHPGPWGVDEGSLDLAEAVASLPAGLVEVVACGPKHDPAGAARGRGIELRGIELHGRDGGRRMARLAARCHLAALPSRRRESYALALDEVFALGLPAWVTYGTVAAERYDRDAFETLPARTPGAWAEALRALVREPWRSARAFEALPEEVPTAARAAASLENLYEDVLASSRAAARDAA